MAAFLTMGFAWVSPTFIIPKKDGTVREIAASLSMGFADIHHTNEGWASPYHFSPGIK
jgi:hypothetical protein